jgi:ribonuclease E
MSDLPACAAAISRTESRMKRMLFNATNAEESRVAIVDGQKLVDIDIESAGRESRKSNIYKGIVTRVEPSLEACFINYGEERHGFLPFKEISKVFFKEGIEVSKARIQDAIAEGTEIIVQVEKEERGNKGAALTTFISLAGRYLVLMPNNPRGGGVSRRVEGEDRQELRETMDKLEYPNGMSLIARTAGIGRGAEELQWDLNYLMQLWRAIDGAAKSAPGAFLIYQESSLVIRAIRDYFTSDIGEILIDTDDVYEQAKQFMAHVMPDTVGKVKRYRDETPLFSRFQIEHQIETAHSRTVPLPSGGAIVIDHTEALVAVDVNSARATKGSDIEETALRNNLEAAEEVARQMRLRDLGGLIVIDFIDMENSKNQREVESRLKDAMQVDRARVQMGKISRFGLMELSRQRLRPALSEGSHMTCPRCNGTGSIRDIESSALHVLRIIQEEAMKENTAAINTQVPVDVATYLLNEKRGEIAKLEARLKIEVVLIPNKHLETPHYRLERLKHDDERLANYRASYALAEGPSDENTYIANKYEPSAPQQEALVKGITPNGPAPTPVAPVPRAAVPVAAAQQATGIVASSQNAEQGFIGKVLGWFRSKPANESTVTQSATAATSAVAAKPAAGEGRGERSDRGDRPRRERGERGGRNRGDRAERGGADKGADKGTDKGTEKGAERVTERGDRNEPRKPRDPNREPQNRDQNRDPSKEVTPREPRPPREPAEAREGVPAPRERGERGGRGRRERAPRREESAVAETTEAGSQAMVQGSLIENAGASVAGTPGHDIAPVSAEGGAEGDREGRNRRRRRGGRDRGPREEGMEQKSEGQASFAHEGAASEVPSVAVVASVATVAAPAVAVAASIAAAPVAAAPVAVLPVAIVPVAVVPVAVVPQVDVAPVVTPVALAPVASMIPTPAPVVVAKIEPKVVPKAELDSIVHGAGLQWVETVASGPVEEVTQIATPRPVRKRKAKAPVEQMSLQQVETSGDQAPS